MRILELAGFHSNYGSNFIPTLVNLDQELTSRGHNMFYIFSNENLSDGFYEWEIPFSQKHRTTLVNFHSVTFINEISKFIRKNPLYFFRINLVSVGSTRFKRSKGYCLSSTYIL